MGPLLRSRLDSLPGNILYFEHSPPHELDAYNVKDGVPNESEMLREEIRQLHAELRELRNDMQGSSQLSDEMARTRNLIEQFSLGAPALAAMAPSVNSPQPLILNIYFSRSDSPRKPFLMKMDGVVQSTQKLSTVRAAILLVLLLDFQDRCESGQGVVDPMNLIVKSCLQLENQKESSDELLNKLRVAMYRFNDYCKANKPFSSLNKNYSLEFNLQNTLLVLCDHSHNPVTKNISVQITTDDTRVATVIDQTLSRSPIERVRRRKALYVPAGPEGSDRMLLEMYDHNFPLKVTSLYVRPPFPSYPTSLLEFIGVSDKVLLRKQLAFEGYRSGRFEFFEVLPQDTIWDMIRFSPERGFKMYPRNVTKEQVLDHFDNLIYILNTYENYNFYLTGASIPFVLVTYELKTGPVSEYFNVFFQAFNTAATRDLGCFVLCDPFVYQSITDNIVNWILAHPSTVRDRADVVRILKTVRDHLEEQGPLPMDPEEKGTFFLYGR